MRNMLHRLFLMIMISSLSVFVYAAMENNSILRFQSTDKDGNVVYAVAMEDGSIKALTSDDADYKLENSLWLAHGSDNGFNIQNLGTEKYLNQDDENGTKGTRHFLITSNQALSLRRNNTGYYWNKGFLNDLYIQYDPNLNRWFFYSSGTGSWGSTNNKGDSQQNGDFKWTDTNYPISSENGKGEDGKGKAELIEGGDVQELVGATGSGNLTIEQVKDKVVDYVEKKDVEAAPAVPIVVGDSVTYPRGNYWKNATIQLSVNSSDWTPVSFPVDVECVTDDLSGVGYQYYDTEERATKGKGGWKTVTEGIGDTVFYQGVAYNFATDSKKMTLEFEPKSKTTLTTIENSVTKTLRQTGGDSINANWYYIGNALFKGANMSRITMISRYKYNKSLGKWKWEEEPVGDTVNPFDAFFVQYSGDYAMSASVARTNAPMRDRKIVTEKYCLNIVGEGIEDKTYLYFEEEASAEGYVIGEDFLSFATKGRSFTEIYTYEDDIEFSFNTRPMENTFVKVGLYVGKAGRYTISLDNISGNAESMVLYDNYEQDFARLHLGETYTFDSEKGSFDDRFAVAVTYAAPGTTTDNVSLSAVNMVVVGDEIQGLVEGADYAIYNSIGHLVYSDVADAETVMLPDLNSGVYIVRTATGWVKFVVK